MSEKDVNSSSFSWTDEIEKALSDSKEEKIQKSSFGTSIFTTWDDKYDSSNLSGGYKYDYPESEGYVYSPESHTSSDYASSIFSDRKASYQPRRDPNAQRASQTSFSGERRRTAPASSQGSVKTPNGERPRPKRKPEDNTSQGKNGKKQNLNKKKKASDKKSTQKAERKSAKTGKGSPKPGTKPSNKSPKNKSAAKIEAERERRNQAQVDKSNRNYDIKRDRGYSTDEIRRGKVKSNKRARKFRMGIVVALLVIAVLGGVGAYFVLEGRPVAKFNIEGSTIYKKAEILKAGDLAVGDNIYVINKKKVSRKISTNLPYIESVEVKRQYPDNIKLTITETTDKIHIVNGKNFIVVDKNDKILSNKKKKISKDSYKLIGLKKQNGTVGQSFVPDKDNEKKYELAKEIIAALEKTGIKDCKTINLENLKKISISCSTNLTIYADKDTDLERQLLLAKETIREKSESEIKGYVDLRFEKMVVHKDGELL